jgi:hypothetical protein
MARTSMAAALAVLGLMLVAANAEVFFQEDFTGTLRCLWGAQRRCACYVHSGRICRSISCFDTGAARTCACVKRRALHHEMCHMYSRLCLRGNVRSAHAFAQ